MKKLLLILLLSIGFSSIELKPIHHGVACFSSLAYLYCTTDDFWYDEVKNDPVRPDLQQHFIGGVAIGALTSALEATPDKSDKFALAVILGWETFYYITEGVKPDMWDIAIGLIGYYSYKGLFTIEHYNGETQAIMPVMSIKF